MPYEIARGRTLQAKAEYYRELAERCRKLATDIPDADASTHMLEVAQQYRLAEEARAKGR